MAVVFYSKNLNYEQFVKHIFNDFKEKLVVSNSFLIKPNIVSYESYPTTTHPEMLQAVILNLQALGKLDITVADAPAADAGSSYEIIQRHPLKEICDRLQVPLLNLYKTKTKKIVSSRFFPLRIFSLPTEKDFVINLPVLKEHSCCGLTGALKNLFGYLPRQERLAFHGLSRLGKDILAKGIAEINVAAKPHLTIMDAKEILLGCQEQRHGGKVKKLGYLLASDDPVALDSFGLKLLQTIPKSKLLGVPLEGIGHLKYARDYKVGSFEYEEREIIE